ncbi:MAG: hypothetical protein ABW250_15340 [Pyrinomonadaceae bacterium]
MNPGEYRRDYAAYRSAVELTRFEHHAGLSPAPDPRPFEERYADLWTREAFADLRRAFDETPAQFETERAGLRALAGASAFGYAEAHAREVAEELGRCADAGTFDWGGARVRASESPRLLAAETDAERRGELVRRWLDAVGACDDLRAARLEASGEAARALGFGGRLALYEEFTGASLEALAPAAEAFLRRTEAAYMTVLSAWAARELPPGHAPEYADRFFFESAGRTAAGFPARDFGVSYTATLAGLGVRAGSQTNLRVDVEPRAGKRDDSACFAVAPPEDVRLVVGARAGGLEFHRRSFFEGGRAQMFAWASREASRRYPEFVYAPDRATEAGHGLLLSSLLREPAWLAARRGTRAAEAEEAARASALLDLYAARRACASVIYALAIERAGAARSEALAQEYASLYTDATGFRHEARTALVDADVWFESATDLRARLFAASFREHLRSRHGRRWYESRGAGEELIDVWNTAARHRVEELAPLLWGGESSFELLADSSVAALEGRDG